MLRILFTGMMMVAALCTPLMALSVVDTTVRDKQITITFDEAISGGRFTGFEVADKRYGRFTPASATAQGNNITLSYESYASAKEQQENVVWRYRGNEARLNSAGALQSYTGEIRFKAVPLGKYPAVGKVYIACVGDSITHGYGIRNPHKRYPENLGRMLGERFCVGRFGNSGKTAGKCQPGRWYGEQKEFTAALAFKADVYISNLGINDTSDRWWKPDATERDYATLIQAFRGSQNATVVLWVKLGPDFCGIPGKQAYPGNVFKGYSFPTKNHCSASNRPIIERIIAKLARKYDCETMDAYTEMAKDPEMYKVDGLHPTPEGATKLAKLTYNWLSKPYKLPQK